MKETDKKKYKNWMSEVSEIRRKYWSALRAIRNDILYQYRDKPDGPVNILDEDAKALLQTVNDMWESGVMEEMRRRSKTPRSKTVPLCPLCSAPLKDFNPKKKSGAGGLYTSDKLCKVCGLPLSGKQRDFCSEKCRSIKRSRKWRATNPDKKNESNRIYLNWCHQDKLKSRQKSK